MECLAGVAAAGGVGAKEVFEYNRENFMYDRRLRMKKELKLQEFRIEQAKLWREDVRDLISLTEYKMHVYLLVNVLMLGITVVLYTEGDLPPHTPNWLMMGFAVATAGSFMFLLLSIWMAMQAAVAAQSYEARLLTQLVRLPIPSWQEIEACRTYGSEFESTEPRQMFRVPFVTGRQERLVRAPAGQAAAGGPEPQRSPYAGSEAEESEPGSGTPPIAGSPMSSSSRRPSLSTQTGRGAGSPQPVHADPWGLERRGDGIYELGCRHGHDVAELRHIVLARHAMTYWQTYDAFARVSMSIGVNQLLLAMCYYLIGYIMVEVGSASSATYGVVLLTFMAETLARLDMSLSLGQLRFLQVLLLVGPATSCYAGYHWTSHTAESAQTAETLVVLSFFSHSMYLGLMSHFCKIRPQDNGAMLPTAFRSVLYLDVFGWLKLPQHDEALPDETASSISGVATPTSLEPAAPPQARPGFYASDYPGVGPERAPSEAASDDGRDLARPALAAVRYADGRPVPQRPEDMAPSGAVQDMRGLPEAPQAKRVIRKAEETAFYQSASWLPRGGGGELEDVEGWAGPVVTGHEKEPGILPWVVFSTALRALCLAWFASAAYHSLGASEIWTFDASPEVQPARLLQQGAAPGPSRPDLPQLGIRLVREEVGVAWPFPDLEPRSLACDASGGRFVVSDGLALYAAALQSVGEAPALTALRADRRKRAGRLQMKFQESPCPVLAGEGLQDVALVCAEAGGAGAAACKALVLHQHGRRVALCSAAAAGELEAAGQGSQGLTANVSAEWLERLRSRSLVEEGSGQGRGSHGRVEKAVAITFDAECGAAAIEPARVLQNCTILGTTHGRAVRLRRQLQGDLLIPVKALRERKGPGDASLRPGALRALHEGRVGILEANGQSIQVFNGAGHEPVGSFLPPPASPMATFCVGGGYIYALGEGPSPQLWRARLPQWLLLNATR